MPETVLRDKLPPTLSYPISAQQIEQGIDRPAQSERLALYFLYESGRQTMHYDPKTGLAQSYPVLVLLQGLPTLPVEIYLGDLERDPDVRSILVFPVKVRLKARISEVILQQGLRPIRNWLSVEPHPDKPQRPLVLIYDEATQRISSKFAASWDGPEQDRYYT